jgi:retron-type reverse transcriptase
VDKQILRLIKMWFKAPIVEEREDGKKEYKGNDKGTPQGGVISPLLANIYLNVLDTLWAVKKVQECCFAHYFDATFLIRLMDSDYFEGSHIGGLPFVFFRSVRSKPIAHVLH